MPERQRLFLIDGYSTIFRAFYAIRGLSNSKGQPTNAVYGFLQMLKKLLADEEPELVGIALDVGGRTVRKERYEEYKANRKPMPDDLRAQMEWIRQVIEAYRIPILELERYEADDVLGTLAGQAAAAGVDVVLVSADKDLAQLVDEHVSMLHTGRDKLYDPEGVAEDYGVPPERIVDVLALEGDSSDNVPGVPGIGAKGARQLIHEFGSLDELLERAEEVKRKSYREGLQENREQAELSRELVTIHRDLPLELDLAALRREEADDDALRSLFSELEFYSLLEELGAGGDTELEAEAATETETPQAWAEATSGLGTEVLAQTVGPAGRPLAVVVCAVAGEEGAKPIFADLRRDGLREAVTSTLGAWLADPERRLVGHDVKEILRLAPRREPVAATLFDTMLASYLLRPALRSTALDDVVLDRFQHKATSLAQAGWDGDDPPAPGWDGLAGLAGERAALVAKLAEQLADELVASPGLERVYREIEAPLVPVLVEMEEVGIELDSGFLATMSEELGEEMESLEGRIYDAAGEEFNLNSPQQLGRILFEKLDYPVIKKTRKTKSYSTDADTLQELANRGFEVAELLLRYRELSKLKSTYVDALPTMVAADGRIHTRYEQAVAATGRLSSVNPNLQNIPVRTELGQQIRKAFVAPEGRMLLVADYSQIELRILAHIAEEEELIRVFEAGGDIHRSTAGAVLDVDPELVTPEQRRAAKAINFGIIYGMSAFGLARNLGIPRKEASRFIDAYMERYPGVQRYMDATLERAEEEGKVETLYGRVRWLPELRSRNRNVRENAKRMAINARIQGTAADLLKKAMIAVDRRLRRDLPDVRLLLTVHDELVLECAEDEVERAAEAVREEMTGVESLRVPLVVDAGWGRSWYDSKG